MQEYNNLDLSRGHKQYDAVVKNLEGIFKKIDAIFDVSNYKDSLNKIKEKVKNEPAFKNTMMTENMQLDYEDLIYGKYIEEINKLTKVIEEKYVPFYELYLLIVKIKNDIKTITGENIGDILKDAIKLIDMINNLNTHDIKEKNRLIDMGYQTIYEIILYEEIFDRSDVLSYINYLKVPANRENLGKLLTRDIDKINKNDLINEDLRMIRTEGLGYDYLNDDIIRKVSRNTIGIDNSEYLARKKKAIEDLNLKVRKIAYEKNNETTDLDKNKVIIKNYCFKKSLYSAKLLSLVLVPIITFSAGNAIGKAESNKITEYKTITRTVNLDTGEVIDTQQETFDEHETTYVATITEYTPWRVNPAGNGYIRNAVAYEYIVPEDVDDNYHITADDIEGNVREKYRFVESKDELDDTDKMDQRTITITETYQDKMITQKSKKYIIPGSICGTLLGLAISTILVLSRVIDFEQTKDIINDLDGDIKKYKLNNDEIKKRLITLKDKAKELEKEYNDSVKKYGSIADNFIFEDIDTSWIIKATKTKKRTK